MRSRAGSRSIASLDRWQRLLMVALIMLASALPLVTAVVAARDGWQPAGDVALVGLRSHDVFSSDVPLLGLPTSADAYGGAESYHPGPMLYYLLAPGVAVVGPRLGLLFGAALINGLALGLLVWVAHRRGGLILAGLVGVMSMLAAWGAGGWTLHDPLNTTLSTFPMLLAVLLCWSILLGDVAIVPLFLVAATFASQVHLASASFAAPLVLLAASSILLQVRRRGTTLDERRWLAVGAGVVLLLWSPVLISEATAAQSNVAALWHTALASKLSIGLPYSLERLGTSLAPVPIFARRGPLFGIVSNVPGPLLFAGYLLAGIVGATAVSRALARRRPLPQLACTLLVAGLFTVLLTSRLPPFAAVRPDALRGIRLVGALVWTTALWTLWLSLPATIRRRSRDGVAIGLGAIALLVGGLVVAGEHGLASERDGSLMAVLPTFSRSVREQVPQGTYRVTLDGGVAVDTFGPAMVSNLEGHGYRLLIDIGEAFARAYGNHRRFHNQHTDGTLVIATGDKPPTTPGRLILQRRINVENAPVTDVRVYWERT